MHLNGSDYDKRLAGYSRSTLVLMWQISRLPEEIYDKATDITTNSELTEEQVVAQLKELLKEHGAKDLANKKGELK